MMSLFHWTHYAFCNPLQEKDIQTYDYFETVDVCAIFVLYLLAPDFKFAKKLKENLGNYIIW